ncbi:urease accessory protein UreF [Luteolibacter algae]|uniref:Urease accessory protein UreF n=1 Tax=Luteolibacter algae TaxID=454151 RepID=A0ABW5DB16_9BACT
MSDGLLWLLQSNDTGYPSGGYAHSYGLEELVRAGVVTTADELERYLMRQVLPALLKFELPFFARAHAAAVEGDSVLLAELDAELDGWRIAAELRDASRRVGSQRLGLLCELDGDPLITDFQKNCPRAHHLVVTALELRGVGVGDAARAFSYQAVVAGTAASMKLMRIGQTACQGILYRVLGALGTRISDSLEAEIDGFFNPLLEIASLKHAVSNERLFIS